MRLTIAFAAFYLALTLSGCAKKVDDCDGGCKGWKPDSGMTDKQKAVYGIHSKS